MQFVDEFNEQNRILPDSRRFSGEDFLQRTAGKLGRNRKIRNMGFFQKIPIYQIRAEFAENGERFGRYSRCSGRVFHKCGQI